MNELLSNAFKHAFEKDQPGNVWVELTSIPGQRAKLVVRDNGRGLPDDMPEKCYETLGMQIVELLAEQIGAELTISSDQGARFELTFSLNESSV